jgi:hypothetical protein
MLRLGVAMFALFYGLVKLYIWMFKLLLQFVAAAVVLVIALYGWMGLGLVWVVSPDKPAVTRSSRKFNRWLNRTLRQIM